MAARRLYERLGFVDVATLPDYYGPGQPGRRMLRVPKEKADPVSPLPRPIGLV